LDDVIHKQAGGASIT